EVFTRAKWLADRHSPLLEQQVLCDFLVQGHMDRHVRRMRKLYERKRKTVIDALKNHFGSRISVLGDAAGINVVMRIKTRLSDDAIVEQAAQAGIGISSTSHCYLGKSPRGEFLFNYADLQDAQIEYCILRLAEITA
ncbi:MAG: PLP-dependent aminotransferase family protein, partial [Leptolyngbya sp.]|nr:PLP-dependent aminotransferase family protein [Candidatus Melainabacteria bacterium]